MAHAQKTDFVFRRNGRVHLNRRGASVHSTTGSRGVLISGSNAGYTMFRGSVKGTGYTLHSPVSPSLPLPCVIVCHHISTALYNFVRGARVKSQYVPMHAMRVCGWMEVYLHSFLTSPRPNNFNARKGASNNVEVDNGHKSRTRSFGEQRNLLIPMGTDH